MPVAGHKRKADNAASSKTRKMTTRPRQASKSAPLAQSKRRAVHDNRIDGTSPAATPPNDSSGDSTASPSPVLSLFVCGTGSGGELGLGTGKKTAEARLPRLNPNLLELTSCTAGGMHAAAVTHDNQLLTWGVNDNGALGRDTQWKGAMVDANPANASDSDSSDDDDDMQLNPREATPTAVDSDCFPSGTKFVQVAAGDSATFALTADGHVYGWGTFRDHNGAYGFTLDRSSPRPKIVKYQWRPLRIPGLEKIVQISAGTDFALALNSKGQVFAWGCGEQCELGRRLVERRRPQALLPTQVGFARKRKVRSIHAASNHAFAVDEHGDTWSWGLNNFGQTGIATNAGQAEAIVSIPTKVRSLNGQDMTLIAGGIHHSIGLTANGKCLVWGRLDGDQMGLDIKQLVQDNPSSVLHDEYDKPRCLLEPTALPIPPCRHVAAGSDHCLAVTSEGKAYSWGFNATYQCGQPTDDDIKVAALMNGKSIREAHVVWAGAGGQYSMLAATHEVKKDD